MANKLKRKQKKAAKARARRKDYIKRKNMWHNNVPTTLTRTYSPRPGDGILPSSKRDRPSKKRRKMEAELHALAGPLNTQK